MRNTKKPIKKVGYFLIILFAIPMIFPIIWLIFASVKPSNEVLNSISLLPSKFYFSNFKEGWYLIKPFSFLTFFYNTFVLVISCVIGGVLISLLVGYAFARLPFRFKPFWLSILFLTIMLPTTSTLVSRYVIFSNLGWTNTYLPFIVPSFLGVGVGGGFFIYLVNQFIKGIPRELDDAAKIDGCSSLNILLKIITPLCSPAIFSIAIFAFMWNWDDFQNQLIYISKIDLFTVSLAMRSTIDVTGADNWGAVMAIALCSIIPATVLFFSLQKYFVEGISTAGIKG